MGNHVTVTIAGVQGHLERNVFEPVIIQNVPQSCRLLPDSAASFARSMDDGAATGPRTHRRKPGLIANPRDRTQSADRL